MRSEIAGLLCGKDPEGFVRFKVHEGGSHDPVVHEFEGPAPQLDAGDMSDGVCSTAIHFNIDKELLDLTVLSRIFQPDETAPEHGHSHTNRLSRAQMTMSFCRGRKKFFKIFHFLYSLSLC